MESIDTSKLRENAKDLEMLTKELSEEFDAFFTRISNINTKTLEWVGNSATLFVNRSNIEKIEYNKIINTLDKYAKFINAVSNEYDILINKLR